MRTILQVLCVLVHTCSCMCGSVPQGALLQGGVGISLGRGPRRWLFPLPFTSAPDLGRGALRVQTKMSFPGPPLPCVPNFSYRPDPHSVAGRAGRGVHWGEGGRWVLPVSSRLWVPAEGPIKLRDEFHGLETSLGRPQGGRIVGIRPGRLPGGRGVHTETRRRRNWSGRDGAQGR